MITNSRFGDLFDIICDDADNKHEYEKVFSCTETTPDSILKETAALIENKLPCRVFG